MPAFESTYNRTSQIEIQTICLDEDSSFRDEDDPETIPPDTDHEWRVTWNRLDGSESHTEWLSNEDVDAFLDRLVAQYP